MVVRDDALPSLTEVERLASLDGPDGLFSLLSCRPISGRQHQIRAHLAAVGHAIVGDKLYAHGDEMFAAACDGRLSDEQKAVLLLPRHALHAQRIEVPHPDGHNLAIEAPLPPLLAEFIERNTCPNSSRLPLKSLQPASPRN